MRYLVSYRDAETKPMDNETEITMTLTKYKLFPNKEAALRFMNMKDKEHLNPELYECKKIILTGDESWTTQTF